MRNFTRFAPDRYSRKIWVMVFKLCCHLVVTHVAYVLALLETHCCVGIGWDRYADHMLQNLEVPY